MARTRHGARSRRWLVGGAVWQVLFGKGDDPVAFERCQDPAAQRAQISTSKVAVRGWKSI